MKEFIQLFKSGLFKSIVPNLNITALLQEAKLVFQHYHRQYRQVPFCMTGQPVPERLGISKWVLVAFGLNSVGLCVGLIRGVG